MMMTNSSINHKYKSHFNLLWGGGAKLPPYFITERKIYERIVIEHPIVQKAGTSKSENPRMQTMHISPARISARLSRTREHIDEKETM